MFEPLPAKHDFPQAEKTVLEFWDRHDVFAESIRSRDGAPRFVFYEGPPTANGLPHPGHCLTRVMKDIFPRYRTMTGHKVERKGGWDTHGLPVEREVCKELGLKTKLDIDRYGIEKFNLKCIQSVFRYTREWEEMTRRLAYWVDLKDAYVTFHQSYVESVWWSLKTLFERGVLYQGHKVVWWWAQGGTALSSGEVGEGYKTVDDPSVFVKFPLVHSPGEPKPGCKVGKLVGEKAGETVGEKIGEKVGERVGGTGVSPVPPSSPSIGPNLTIRRRYLPHWEAGGSTYFVTFRTRSGELSPDERTLVLNAAKHFDGQRYCLHAAVVMPDHVHLLITPTERQPREWWSLADLMHSIKSFAAHQIAKRRGSSEVWMEEYFDRIIRSGDDFEEKQNYILTNPDKRGLGADYPWAWMEDQGSFPLTKNAGDGRDARTTHSELRPVPNGNALPEKTSLLVWTTTPWTLISNHFAAVHPDLEYALVHDPIDDEHLYIAAALVEAIAKKVKRELRVVSTCKGSTLVDLCYHPPFAEVYFGKPAIDTIARLTNIPHQRLLEIDAKGLGAAKNLGSYEATRVNTDLKVRQPIGWRITPADFVTIDSGTGAVHEAPAFGEVDFALLQAERDRFVFGWQVLPVLCAVAPDGTFNADAPERYRGRWVKDCDKEIVRELRDERKTPWGTPLLYHQEQYRHDYPFCPQSPDDPLIQYARSSWFVRTSSFKDEFLKNNAAVNWLPDHIKEGRFGDFLRNNVDWALSRERYWGTPLPIWKCESCGRMEAIGSFAELAGDPARGIAGKPGASDGGYWEQKVAEHKGEEFPAHLRVHKPYVDEWTYECSTCAEKLGREGSESVDVSPASDKGQRSGEGLAGGGPVSDRSSSESGSIQEKAGRRPVPQTVPRMRRVPEVIDCWWDAGSMPFAQWGFPHKEGSIERFSQRFPADFISEAIDQTRGWFYGLLAISTLLQGELRAGSTAFQAVSGKHLEPGSTAFQAVSGKHLEPGSTAFQAVSGATAATRPVNKPLVTSRLSIRNRQLPHWEAGGSTYFVTFRIDSGELSADERTIVLNACRYWDRKRLNLHAAVVMPDHVHLLCTPTEKSPGQWWSLAELLHSIKSFTANEINRSRGGGGHVWQREYYDRIIRNAPDFEEKWMYVVSNPTRRGLPEDYEWTWVEEQSIPESDSDRLEGGATRGHVSTSSHGYPIPFRTCIVLGHIAGEDGNKMSKKLRNYKEPSYVFDTLGADAMRWYFLSAQAPWTSTRFAEAAIRDSQREFLVKLYNVLSFFTIYASIDGFDPRRRDEPGNPMGYRPAAERGELDRWIISELRGAVAAVRESMDRFENYPAAQKLNDFVDALSNWYVRRSRDRFWRAVGSADQDKWDAYHTLYGCLRVFSRLIAPFTPFFAETMHQTLRVPADPVSVHLCDYPKPDDIRYSDEALSIEMNMVREIASLGRAGRAGAAVKEARKVRQPLARVEIVVARPELEAPLRRHSDLIAEELNVKAVEFTTEADEYVTYKVVPNFKAIGEKYRALVPKIKAALGAVKDAAAARKQLLAENRLPLAIDGPTVDLTASEVEIRLEARPGWAAAQGRVGVVVLSTEITPELRDEGLVREFIHHVQALRKERELAYEARISLHVDVPPALADVLRQHVQTIKAETLATGITFAAGGVGDPLAVDIEGHAARIWARTASESSDKSAP